MFWFFVFFWGGGVYLSPMLKKRRNEIVSPLYVLYNCVWYSINKVYKKKKNIIQVKIHSYRENACSVKLFKVVLYHECSKKAPH